MTDIARVGATTNAGTGPRQPGNEHVVRRGDTLWGIARQHGVSLGELEAANPHLARNDFIFPGDRIALPGGNEATHVVRAGETVGGIAERHGVSARAVADANQLRRPDLIHPGDRLTIPGGQARPQAAPPPLPASRPQPAPAPIAAPVAAPAVAAPAAEAPGTTGLRTMFEPALGSRAVGAVVIGQAEGTRTPDGGFRAGYYGHTDPGNGVANRGSFSLQNAGTLTPEQADARQLTRLGQQIPAFETAARGAGLDPNDAALATAYLDLYNQSPTAAARFVDQLDYLSTAGITTESLVELRVRSFVDHATGERFRLPSGAPAGGGFVNIARNTLGREPSEREVQAVIRRDQDRRVTAMAAALPQATAPANVPTPRVRPEPAAPAPATGGPARFTSNAGLDLTPVAIDRTNALHDAVRDQTGFAIHVTSGRRGPDRQAAAMYNNLADGSSPRYRNQAAFNEVRDAFNAGRAEGLGRQAIVDRMATVLQAQSDRGVLISRHMSDRAVDLRLPPAGSRDTVIAAIRDNPAVQSVGIEDDHLHIQFH